MGDALLFVSACCSFNVNYFYCCSTSVVQVNNSPYCSSVVIVHLAIFCSRVVIVQLAASALVGDADGRELEAIIAG